MILYGSHYGAVREYVQWILEAAQGDAASARPPVLPGDLQAWDLKKQRRDATAALTASDPAEPILIAAPVYAGQLFGAVRSFLQEHEAEILKHPLALAVTSLYNDERPPEEVISSYPSSFVSHASRTFLIGGRLRQKELPFIVRIMIRKITGSKEDMDTLDRTLVPDILQWLSAPQGQ
jgi:menaquinone-dependent protoporphyrinogen IX oxidase